MERSNTNNEGKTLTELIAEAEKIRNDQEPQPPKPTDNNPQRGPIDPTNTPTGTVPEPSSDLDRE